MRTIVATSRKYRCEVCSADYAKAKDAAACEAGTLEPRAFAAGDRVRAKARRPCHCGRRYVCAGRIAKVLGPFAYDAEWLLKGFGIGPEHGHVWFYEVVSRCPKCGERKRVRYPAGALVRVRRSR